MVVNYAVVGRVKASGDGVVVGECEGGEDGDEAGLGLGPIGDEAGDVWSWGLELVSESEPVRGDEEDDGFVEAGERAGGEMEVVWGDVGWWGLRGEGEEEEGKRNGGGQSDTGGEEKEGE